MSELYFGTCSWKYNEWKGWFYSDTCKNYLTEYSKKLNSVEVDQWFWSLFEKRPSLPLPAVVKDYAASVPDNFKFTIKLPNSLTLTHYQNKSSKLLKPNHYFLSNDLMDDFLNSIKLLSDKVGVLMFQFEYLNKQKMESINDFLLGFQNFYEKLDKSFKYGIEIRNPNYLNEKYFNFIKQNNLAMVFLHGYYMPPVWEVFNKYKDYIVGTVVFRLHGEDRRGMEVLSNKTWNKIYVKRDNELSKIAMIVEYLLSKEVDIFMNINNHYEGCAPLTIEKLKDLINNRTVLK